MRAFYDDLARALGLEINKKSTVATHTDDQFEPFRDTGLTHTPGGHKILDAFIATTDAQESAWVLAWRISSLAS